MEHGQRDSGREQRRYRDREPRLGNEAAVKALLADAIDHVVSAIADFTIPATTCPVDLQVDALVDVAWTVADGLE